jgi:ubiquinone/menaquinone biosynthesis C-methylase UbiE
MEAEPGISPRGGGPCVSRTLDGPASPIIGAYMAKTANPEPVLRERGLASAARESRPRDRAPGRRRRPGTPGVNRAPLPEAGRRRSDRGEAHVAASNRADTLELQARGENLRAILESLPLAGVRSIVEVGCGSGAFARMLAAHLGPGVTVVGLDCSAGSIGYAREQAERAGVRNVAFVHGDVFAESTTASLAPCDLAFCRYLLMYMVPKGRQRPLLARMRGLVRPGGRVACVEVDANFGQERYPPAPEPLATILAGLVDYYRRAGLIEWRCGLQLFFHLKQAGLGSVEVKLADGRIIQGGAPPALVEHGGRDVEALLGPCARALGLADRVDEAARQYRAYLGTDETFLYTPVFVGSGAVPG